MELVSKYCLDIRQMLFMFQNTHCRISILTNFHHLEDLDLWGGAFYTDGICELLEQIGHRLKKLNLCHVEEIDWKALAIITITCPNLTKFGIQNCEFMDEEDRDYTDEDPFR